jgi:hypothetical protein
LTHVALEIAGQASILFHQLSFVFREFPTLPSTKTKQTFDREATRTSCFGGLLPRISRLRKIKMKLLSIVGVKTIHIRNQVASTSVVGLFETVVY